MRVTVIAYSESREHSSPYGLKSWKKFSIEGEIGENESPDTAQKTLVTIVENWHNSFSENEMRGTYIRQVEDDREVGMVAAINACTELDVLKTFALLSKSNPEHRAAYEKKYEELSK